MLHQLFIRLLVSSGYAVAMLDSSDSDGLERTPENPQELDVRRLMSTMGVQNPALIELSKRHPQTTRTTPMTARSPLPQAMSHIETLYNYLEQTFYKSTTHIFIEIENLSTIYQEFFCIHCRTEPCAGQHGSIFLMVIARRQAA